MSEQEYERKMREAVSQPKNVGEMSDADAIGTVGSPDCGDMLRMWVKFREENGRKVIDKATFQTFGCETAIAVASMATEMLAGKTAEEALAMSGEDLSAPLGPLPPMKIHCAQLVEGALRNALDPDGASDLKPSPSSAASGQSLLDQLSGSQNPSQKPKIRFKE